METPDKIKTKRTCADCLSERTYLSKTENGTPYLHWYKHPYIENGWRCAKCERNQSYHRTLPSKRESQEIRRMRMRKRMCDNCGDKITVTQGPYYIWHKHPDPHRLNAWLCAKCYAYDHYPRKYKTREEVNARHKEWALQNIEHMRVNSIKGCVAAQKYGKNGNSKPERSLKRALRHLGVNFIGNHPYKYGEIDIFIPVEKIALFADGEIWYADPRRFNPNDILPYSNRVAKDIWKKDFRNSEYLRSQGFIVIRFWEREIRSNIENCLETILGYCGTGQSEVGGIIKCMQ
jgi:DNA mismatch endonuclease, patch repair protein